MSSVVYLKTFERDDGTNGYYVGITSNFERRMKQHERDAYSVDSNLLVHKAMRKYNHKTEILTEIDDRELILEAEIAAIKVLRDASRRVYNMTDGGERIKKIITRYRYETVTVTRNRFKNICRDNNWDFEDFLEFDTGQKECYGKRLYYYIGYDRGNDPTAFIFVNEAIENTIKGWW